MGNQQQIIFISDGSSKVIGGYGTLLSGWLIHNNMLGIEIIILTPNSVEQKYNRLLAQSFPEFDILVNKIDFHLPKDIYFLKLIILKYLLESKLNPKTKIIYLDYDHIVLSSTVFPLSENSSILISSEFKENEIFNKKMVLNHYNTSLIISNVEILKKISISWKKNYRGLKESVPIRFLEEISFSRACESHNIIMIPVSIHLQSGWHNNYVMTSLFHYGGLTQEAFSIKKELSEMFSVVSSDIELRIKSFQMAKKYLKYFLGDKIAKNIK